VIGLRARREFGRVARVAATMRKILAGAIGELAREHGLALVAITEVDVAPDLRQATVFVSVYADALQQRAFLDALARRARELHAALARSLRTRHVPVLQFELDTSIAHGARIDELLRDPPPS
jgi:ribosome-binding factor A